VGGGFAGLNVAKALYGASVKVTLVDKRNFHLFQPLLYQVATGGVSPGDIAHPLRAIFRSAQNISVQKAEVIDIDPAQQQLILQDGSLTYDTLVLATGSSHHYFGQPEWGQQAPGLKTIEDALEIRRRILLAFEAAEREPDPAKRRAWLTFVIVGGGPTGVELAGTLAELTYNALGNEFQNIDPAEAKIILLEAMDRVLPPYPANLSAKAEQSLMRLGVSVQTKTMVTDIRDGVITVKLSHDGREEEKQIRTKTVLWGAGMKASPLGQVLAKRTGVELDKSGRVIVEPDLSLPGYPNLFVIGDLANFSHQDGEPLPGLAAVAMQQGKYVAELIKQRLAGHSLDTREPFHYRDKGQLSIIGRNAAVAEIGPLRLSGFKAWLIWVFVHIYYLIGFDNKVLVLLQWAWSYFTYNRGARLITNEQSFALVRVDEDSHSPVSS
jgi:NADH dehydrogenase